MNSRDNLGLSISPIGLSKIIGLNRTRAMEKPEWYYPDHIVYQQILDTRTWWTKELINQFLEPDLIVPNIHNSFQVMRLYLLHKVISIEKTSEFKEKCCASNKKVDINIFHQLKIEKRKAKNKKAKNRRLKLRRKNESARKYSQIFDE